VVYKSKLSCQGGVPKTTGRTGSKGAVGWHSLYYFRSHHHEISTLGAALALDVRAIVVVHRGVTQSPHPDGRLLCAFGQRALGLAMHLNGMHCNMERSWRSALKAVGVINGRTNIVSRLIEFDWFDLRPRT
jgi:hypothetical protein